jgi:hypothetical protein
MAEDKSYLARQLLNSVVTFPEDEPEDPDVLDLAKEVTFRLDELLDQRLPAMLFDGYDADHKNAGDRYGADAEAIINRYEALCLLLRTVARTGQVSGDAIARGVETIDILLPPLEERLNQMREWLGGEEERKKLLEAAGVPTDSRTFEVLPGSLDQYELFTLYDGSKKALVTLRDGLIAIDQAPDKPKPGPIR